MQGSALLARGDCLLRGSILSVIDKAEYFLMRIRRQRFNQLPAAQNFQ